eukprot:gene21974-16424_t
MELITTLLEPANLLAMFVAVLVFATVLTFAIPMLERDRLSERMKSVANRRDELRRQARSQMRNESPTLRQTDEGFAKNVVDMLQLSKFLEDPKVAEYLAQAGYRGPRPMTTFYFFRLISPFVLLIFAVFYLFVMKAIMWLPQMKMTACAAAFVAGFY